MKLKTGLKTFVILFLMMSCAARKSTQTIKNTVVNPNQSLIKPPNLKKGDTIVIVTPASFLKTGQVAIQDGIDLMKSWGLHVVLGENVFKINGHFSGTDDERASDFQKGLDDPKIKAIWCARGGYGAVRILDKLDYTRFKKHPKWIVGYSDITAIHNQIHNLGYQSLHALMGVSLNYDKDNEEKDKVKQRSIVSLKKALFGEKIKYDIKPSNTNKLGAAKGQLIGGNLTLLHTMLGSKTSMDTSGKIIFIEEIGEKAYHIDRMLQSLKRAGYFNDCNGIIVGDFSSVKKNDVPFGKTINEIILDNVSEYDFPVLFNFPAGHKSENRTLILGNYIELKVNKENCTIIFD
jgi:muramoyltetrapeptide carboxypeptidase